MKKQKGHWAKKKEERFEKVATNRVNEILEGIRKLSNCSNRLNYKYDKKQADQIFNQLQSSLDECKSLFEIKKKGRPFKLEDIG